MAEETQVVATEAPQETQVPAPEAAVETEGLAAAEVATQAPEAEEPAPVEGAPEAYEDFVDPDGNVAFTSAEMGEFTAMAKELNLTQEKAQKLLMTMLPTMKNRLNTSLTEVRKDWGKRSSVDPEFGGENYKANLEIANRAFKKFATPEISKLLQKTGLFAHPDFIRMYYRIGKSMSQDMGVTGQGSPQPRRRLFPNSNMAL